MVGTELETIFGAGLAIEADAEGQLLIGCVARVVVADLLASNGVIDAIDRLLEPPARTDDSPDRGSGSDGRSPGASRGADIRRQRWWG